MALFYIRTIIILSPLPLKMFASQINVDWSCYIKYSVKTGHWGNSELSRKKFSFAFHFLEMCRTQIMLSSHNDKLMQNMTNNTKLCKKAQIWNKNKPKKIPQQWRAQQSSLFLTGIWLFALFQGIVFNSHYFICLLNTLPFMP